MLSDPKIKLLIKEYWSNFLKSHLEDLMAYIDDQAFIIRGAKARNLELWNRNLVTDEIVMKQWIENRITYMNSFINSLQFLEYRVLNFSVFDLDKIGIDKNQIINWIISILNLFKAFL